MKFFALILLFGVAQIAAFTSIQRTSPRSIATEKFLFGNPEPSKNNQEEKGGGMFAGMGNMMESMKKAQEIAKMSGIINKELMELNVVGNDPAQQVFATYNGMGMPIGIKISDQMATQGGEAVSLACTQAMQDGYKKSQTIMMTKMQALYQGAGLPAP